MPPLAYETNEYIRNRLRDEIEHASFMIALEEYHKNSPEFAVELLKFIDFIEEVKRPHYSFLELNLGQDQMDAFDRARVTAAKSNSSGVTRYQHSSVILDRKGRTIASGRNHFAGLIIETEEGEINKTVHSEVHALTKVNIRRLSGATMVNYARTNVAAILARPCPNCWTMLKKLGFTKVFYTERSDLDKPVWVEERF